MRQYIRTFYSPSGTLGRLGFDIAVANVGMFVGTVFSVVLAIVRFPSIFQEYFWEMFVNRWMFSIPFVSLACGISFPLSGIYGIDLRGKYRDIAIPLFTALVGALSIHVFLVYALAIMIPRSMMTTGWLCIALLTVGGRIGRSWFVKRFRIIRANSRLARIDSMLTLASQEEGWLPPDSPQVKAPWPHFEQDEILAAAAILQSGKVNQWTGHEVVAFQDEFKTFCGSRHAIALANGTVALDLAFHALGFQPGDEVVVTPRTFIASAGSAVLAGLKPVFADVDRDSQNITAETIERVLTPRTRAILTVHLAGWPCDMDPIMALAKDRGLTVIEDCAQAHGARYRGRSVGSFGTLAAFSFCQDKIMTTGGEGGMLLTDQEQLWKKAWMYKDHGKNPDKVFQKNSTPGFRWVHDSFGTNWRLTEIQAALGRVQLRKLPEWVEARRRHAAILQQRFSEIPAFRLTTPPADTYHSYYKYYIFVKPEALKTDWNRDRIHSALLDAGVACFSGSCSEIYLEEAFANDDLRPKERLPIARELGETSLMFLVHPTLSDDDMHATADIVDRVISRATR